MTEKLSADKILERLLKQRFARWFNAFHKTYGTLQAERFTSVVVEGEDEALLATCAMVNSPAFIASIPASAQRRGTA